jgi:phage-related minor tail protein
MAASVYSVAMWPVQNALGGALAEGISGILSGVLPFAKGGAFAQGRVTPFAHGGVVASPSVFPMRGGIGLMGEAGPEAILPLARGADGRLGVQAGGVGARAVTVVMNISTPDVQGFQRSQSQIAAQAARALARGQRNR